MQNNVPLACYNICSKQEVFWEVFMREQSRIITQYKSYIIDDGQYCGKVREIATELQELCGVTELESNQSW